MKKISFLTTFLTLNLIALDSIAMQKDHQKHFAVSYGLAVGADVFCGEVLGVVNPYERMLCSFGSSFAVGLAKETWDHTKPNNSFDRKDLMFDIAGAAMGSVSSKIIRDWRVSIYKDTTSDEVGMYASYAF